MSRELEAKPKVEISPPNRNVSFLPHVKDVNVQSTQPFSFDNVNKTTHTGKMANLGSSSRVKADNAALAHDAAILGPIAEAKNATYTIFMNSEAKYTEDTISIQMCWS
jgi:hypothetical protein